MIKKFVLSILTLTSAGAFSCDQNGPYGLKDVTVGAVRDKAKIAALFISTEDGMACYDGRGEGAWCTHGNATLAGQLAQLEVAHRDGRVVYISGRFPIGAFDALNYFLIDKYCAANAYGLGAAHGSVNYINAAGDRIHLDTNYEGGYSYTSLMIESNAQNDFNKVQALKAAASKPVCDGKDPAQVFLDSHGVCRLPESSFAQYVRH